MRRGYAGSLLSSSRSRSSRSTRRGGRRGRRSFRRSSWVTNASRLSATSAGESIGRRNSQTRCPERAVAAWERVAELAGHAIGAERFGAGDAVGVEREGGAKPGGELRDPAQRVWVLERALELGVEDRVGLAGLVAAGVADRLLALVVGPAGAVGDQVAVVADEQVADDLP